MIEEKQAELDKFNREKYGDQAFDVISEGYRIDTRVGHGYCVLSIKKYLRRFVGTSKKANNLVDLLKCRDFLNRMIEVAERDAATAKEVIEH